MNTDVDSMLSRLKRLPARLRITHLAALIRRAPKGSARSAELTALLHALAGAGATRGGRA